MRTPRGTLVWSLAIATLGCAPDAAAPNAPVAAAPTEPAAPGVLAPNGAVGVTAGAVVSYDATRGGRAFSDPAQGGLAYRVTFAGAANGLAAVGGSVVGVPAEPAIVRATVTATDARGRTASDAFAIVAFAGDLGVPVLPTAPEPYADARAPLPAHFTAPLGGTSVLATDNTPPDNPVTDAGAALGRVLFYDPRLSANDALACSGCHVQSLGFGDVLERSVGFAGGLTRRHSPGLANARFYRPGSFFWDQRAASLEAQVVMPIQDATEMGLSLDDLVVKLRATPYYAPLFQAAFGSAEVTGDRVARALAQFVRALVSAGSRYDRAYAGTTANFAATLTAQEQQGEQLFRTAGCASCHATAGHVSDDAHNVGLDAASDDAGAGRGAFKAPSLRNVAVRPPYMHDGRFATLEQVVEFFDSGVRPNPDLDPRLRAADGSPRRLGLTAAQRAALVAYLRALTDSAFLTARRFSNPFAPAPPPPPPGAAVTIQGNAFRPASITVPRGAVVAFTNLDDARHSASFAAPGIVSTPIFRSGTQTVAMPSAPGSYGYQCAVHGAAMRGTVVVQ